MKRQAVLLVTLVVALIGGGCATTPPPYNPFRISQEEFQAKIKMIALAPVAIYGDLDDPEPVKAKFESLIEAKLRDGGLSVVPSREVAPIWKRMSEQVGGYFDPVTGKRDETKFRTVREHTLREINTKFNADAMLYTSIVPVKAEWSGRTASWDGVEEPIRSTGGQIVEAFLFGTTSSGTVGALSLAVIVEDRNGVDMYVNSGGIQVLAKISGGKFIPVPRHELFADEERNVTAVNIALEPLVPKSTTPGAPEKKP